MGRITKVNRPENRDMDRREAATAAGVRASLGDCPYCRTELRSAHLLIEYETRDGPDAFAECPDCDEVVHPE